MYSCDLCKKEFKTKHGLDGHKKKKIPCDLKYKCGSCMKVFKTKQQLENHNNRKFKCAPKDENEGFQNIPKYSNSVPKMEYFDQKCVNFSCQYCNRSYSSKSNLNKHMKICFKKEHIEIQNEQDKKIKDLEDKYNELLKKMENTNSQTIIENQTNTINNTINITVPINAFGEEDTSNIDNKTIKKSINKMLDGISYLIKRVHFNPEMPQNHNVYIPSRKNNFGMIYDGNKWILGNSKEIINKLISTKYGMMTEYCGNKELNEVEKKRMERIKTSCENNNYDKYLIDNTFLLLYNNRDLIMPKNITNYQIKD